VSVWPPHPLPRHAAVRCHTYRTRIQRVPCMYAGFFPQCGRVTVGGGAPLSVSTKDSCDGTTHHGNNNSACLQCFQKVLFYFSHSSVVTIGRKCASPVWTIPPRRRHTNQTMVHCPSAMQNKGDKKHRSMVNVVVVSYVPVTPRIQRNNNVKCSNPSHRGRFRVSRLAAPGSHFM
jgi:hypothetical protein